MTGEIHPAAAAGFEAAVDVYERARPGYPQEVVDHVVRVLRIRPSSRVVELGAGTGKFTRLLEPSGATLVALEPVATMRSELRARSPSVQVTAGTAEDIPLDDGCADAVVAAQAFHWFDGERALAEIHRVLRPEGRLCLLWNVRDEDVDWVARLTEIIDPHQGDAPRYRTGQWRRAFERTELFGPLHRQLAFHVHLVSPETVVERVASISFVAALADGPRAALLGQVRELIRSHPDLAGRERIPVPYRTDVFWCERR
jgi:SAM-dependent methyltransferase